jgi:hypothetical protein
MACGAVGFIKCGGRIVRRVVSYVDPATRILEGEGGRVVLGRCNAQAYKVLYNTDTAASGFGFGFYESTVRDRRRRRRDLDGILGSGYGALIPE